MQLFYENYTKDEIECILRDLSSGEKINIKDLINDYKMVKSIKKHRPKVQKIIDDNQKVLRGNEITSDLERLQYFKSLNIINDSVQQELSNFTTEYGKTRMKLKLLKIAYTQKNKKYIIDLYLQIISNEIEYTKKEAKLMRRVTKYMKSINYKALQFKELSNQLAPLDFYNTYKLELDDWQIQTINKIDAGEDVLVVAPTSCGKTWLSLYPGLQGKKILFIVPTEALIFQVGSMFSKFIKQPTLLGDNVLYITDNNITIGTPKAIEDKLPVLDMDFDIIIVDEVHNLGGGESHHYYERLLKIFSGKQLLALSATIKNPNKLLKWFRSIGYQNIGLVSYSTRFLNLQRQLFVNNKLVKIHPISCLDLEDINSHFLDSNIPMTPYDSILLYESLVKVFPNEMDDVYIARVFPEHNKRLSLVDSRHYESLLKKKLVALKLAYPAKLQTILDEYKVSDSPNEEINLYNLFKEIKRKSLTPCIVFQENTQYCKEIFIKLVGYLEKLETLNYPFYYENLEYKRDEYLSSVLDVTRFKKNIKLGATVLNKALIISDKVKTYERELDAAFSQKYKSRLLKQITKLLKTTLVKKIQTIQIHNLRKELNNTASYAKLKYVDVFRKHPEFSLSSDSPMTADKIRDIKKTISKKMEINVSYTNVFLQGLKRGIGIYTKHMPPVYNMIVQKLSQNAELGFVVADELLALGINMPFRSSCILGYKDSTVFKKGNYLQMIGRAGRRGKDCEGHVIFVNVDWKNLMKSELDEIQSKYVHMPTYEVLNDFTDTYANNVPKVFKFRMDGESITPPRIKPDFDCTILNSIVWKLREYGEKPIQFCKNLTSINASCNSVKTVKSCRKTIKHLLETFLPEEKIEQLDLLIGTNKLVNLEHHRLVHKILKVVINIYNSLLNDPYTYENILIQLKHTFIILKKILNNSNDLN